MTAIDAALEYRKRDLYTVPVTTGEKGCHLDGWQHLRYTTDEIPTAFKADSNLLLILGVNNICDVDLDSQEAIRAARFFLPQTGFRYGRQSKPNSHHVFYLDKAISFEKYVNPVMVPAPTDENPNAVRAQTICEFRCLKKYGEGIGLGTIIPPGVHEFGETIRFEPGADQSIATVDANVLFTAVRHTAGCALLATYWPEDGGGGHRFGIALGGALCQGGLEPELAEKFILATYQARAKFDASNSGLGVARRWVTASYAKDAKDVPVCGFTAMSKLVPPEAKPAVDKALEWLGCARDGMVWEVPLRIDALKPVVPFDPNILPPLLSKYCVGIAKASCVPMEVPVVSAIVAASICVGNRAVIQPKALDGSWQQVPNLWGIVVAEPGSNKSGAMSAAIKPLKKIDGEMQQQSASAKTEYNERMAHYKRALSLHESRMKKLLASDDPDARPPETPIAPQKPPYKQIIVNETTPEKLHEKCIDNPCGLLNFSDELSSWFNAMEKKGHETERALWLKGWTGDQSHSIATLSRGDVYVPKLCLSVLGGMQPAKWREYMRDVVAGAGSDGLVQRLQLMIWPDEAEQTYTDIPADDAITARVEARFRELLAIGADGESPVLYKFSPEAQELFIAWWNRMAAKRAASTKHESIESHYAKYKSLMPSLALIFQLFDDADQRLFDDVPGIREPVPCVVSAVNTQRAVAFCKWLVPHAERSYACMRNSIGVETLTGKIRSGKLEIKPGEWVDSFSYTDILRKEWKGLRDKEDTLKALGMLKDMLWLHYNATKRRYFINPKLRTLLLGDGETS